MLDKRSWLHLAKELPEGRSRRVPHDCGAGTPMLVAHEADGWRAYCHRCADTGWEQKHVPLADKIARLRRQEQEDRYAAPGLPPNLSMDPGTWPAHARAWLARAGMTRWDLTALRIGYSPGMDRVVLPVYAGDTLLYWQARGFDPERPKYINPSVPRDHIVAAFGHGTPLVLTEDYLSAWKVGRVTEAWSLLGTKCPAPVLSRLLTAPDVRVWLDPDHAGQTKARQLCNVLELAGVRVQNVLSDRDPKLLSIEEIKRCLTPPCTHTGQPPSCATR